MRLLTAGEAGKGLAILAQKVRNLATISAEVAKDIENHMLDGYVKLNQKKPLLIKK